jgi:hypothetical protein
MEEAVEVVVKDPGPTGGGSCGRQEVECRWPSPLSTSPRASLENRGSKRKHKINPQSSPRDFTQRLQIRDIFGKYPRYPRYLW